MTNYSGNHALTDFVHFHKLMNRYSGIEFMAVVTINTEKNKVINEKTKIMVQLDGYDNPGTLTFIADKLDPLLYPTKFEVKWQMFEHIKNEYLLITGTHTRKPDIGKFEVKIIPLERTRD